MARLIDADALILHCNDWALSVSPTGRESVKESTLKVKEYDTIETAIEGIDAATTVDAIPVEWLIEKELDLTNKDAALSRAAWLVLHVWRKEQEAQDGRV